MRGVGVRVNTYWQRAPLYVAEETGALVPTKNPVPTLFVPTDMRPRLWAVAGDQAAVEGDGCHLDAGEVHAKECICGDVGNPPVLVAIWNLADTDGRGVTTPRLLQKLLLLQLCAGTPLDFIGVPHRRCARQ